MENINWFEKASLIPSLPKVALDLIETFKNDEPDPKRLARDIEADAVLCARVMRLANSPYYATGREIKSIQEALLVLGFSPVRNIALSAAVSSLGKSSNGMDTQSFARLTLLSGMCCESLSQESGMDKGEAFAAGLMRPIGMLLMRSVRAHEMSALDAQVDMLGPKRADVERNHFGVDHGELSGTLAQRWSLPSAIVEALSGSGRENAAAKLGQWAASRDLAGPGRMAEFASYAPAMEWAHALGLPTPPLERDWPNDEDAHARFGSLAG
jgi:HD-like signal output (HDOD) protein